MPTLFACWAIAAAAWSSSSRSTCSPGGWFGGGPAAAGARKHVAAGSNSKGGTSSEQQQQQSAVADVPGDSWSQGSDVNAMLGALLRLLGGSVGLLATDTASGCVNLSDLRAYSFCKCSWQQSSALNSNVDDTTDAELGAESGFGHTLYTARPHCKNPS